MTNPLLILGDGAPDNSNAGLTAAPEGSVYIDDTMLRAALVNALKSDKVLKDAFVDETVSPGTIAICASEKWAPKNGSWVMVIAGAKLDTSKYPIASTIYPNGVFPGSDEFFYRADKTNMNSDSGGDAIRNIVGNVGAWTHTIFYKTAISGVFSPAEGITPYNMIPTQQGLDTKGYCPQAVLNARTVVPTFKVNTPNYVSVVAYMKVDAGTNSFAVAANRTPKTASGFFYNDNSHEVKAFEHPIQDGVSMSKFFTSEQPSLQLDLAPNTMQIIEDGKWKIVPDYRGTLKTPAHSYDGTKTWQTYKVGEPLPEGFTLISPPSFDSRCQTVLFDGKKWNITTDAAKQTQYQAKDNLAAYYALMPQSIGLRKQPTNTAVAWANWQRQLSSSSNEIEAEVKTTPPRPEGPLSINNPNWFA